MINIGESATTFTPAMAEKDSDAEFSDEAENNTEIVPPSVASRHSLFGDDLRQFRKENVFNSNLFDTTDVQNNIENEPVIQPPGQVARDVNILQNLRIAEVTPFANRRLRNLNLELSPSQPDTPGDGNCFLHAIVDQTM